MGLVEMQFIDLKAQQTRIRANLEQRIASVLDHGKYIMGPEVRELEEQLEAFCGARHAISCANGTDALQLGLMALGVGEGAAVFCPSFTFAATAEVIPLLGATPYFVDADPVSFNMDIVSLQRTISRAVQDGRQLAGVIAVDLFGQAADYDAIEALAAEHDMWVMSDSAQGFGATYGNRRTGSIGTVATTSFFPAKPLGCYGDGGAVFTNDDTLADLIRSLRVHGKGTHKYDNARIGVNSRLDTLQAAVLLEKLAIYEEEIVAREAIAQRYARELQDVIDVPVIPQGQKSVWAQYTLKARDGQNREAIMSSLKEGGVPTVVYYPNPLHTLTAFSDYPCDPEGLPVSEDLSQRVFSLPMSPYLEEHDQTIVIDRLRVALEA